MHDTKNLRKTIASIRSAIYRRRFVLFIILAFLAGGICTGLFISGQRSAASGRLDQRYNRQYSRAAETIGRLEDELERERSINRQLREHNTRAREITEGLTASAERNVRNLQDAVGIIGEVRTKLKVLADFYADSDPGNGDR